jgi:hypothetical protein
VGCTGRTGDAGEALHAGTGDGGDVAIGVDFADDVVGSFGYVEISHWIKDYCRGEQERDGRGGDYRGGGLGDADDGEKREQEKKGDP